MNALLLNGAETTVVLYGQFAGSNAVLTDPTKCPNCKVQRSDFTIAADRDQPAQAAIAAVQADPTLNWIWCYDFCMARTATQLIAAGLQGDIKGAGFDCNAENIQLIRRPQGADGLHRGPARLGGLGGRRHRQPPDRRRRARRAVDPVRLYDVNNVDEFTETDVAQGWQGNFDFKSEYKKVWGVDEG